MGAHSEFFGFHVWFNTGKVLDNDPKDSKRKAIDFQSNLYTKRFSYDINIQYYKGIYNRRLDVLKVYNN